MSHAQGTLSVVRRLTALSALLAITLGPSAAFADPPDLVRSPPIDRARGLLERLEGALELVGSLKEKSVAQLVQSAVASSPEAQLLALYLLANKPKAIVAEVILTAGGGLTDRTGSGDLTAIAGARVAGDYCDLLYGSLAVRGSYDAGLSGEARATAGFCLWQGLRLGPETLEMGSLAVSLFPVRMHGEGALNASPRFSAWRNQPRRRFTEAKHSFSVDGLRVMPSVAERGLTFIYMGFEQRWEWPDVFSGKRGFELGGGFGFVRVFHMRGAEALADRAIDVVDVQLHGMRFDEDEQVAVIDLYPARLRGLGLGSDRVLLDLELGYGGTGGTISSTDCIEKLGCVEEMIMTGADVATVDSWIGNAGLSVGTRARGGGINAARHIDSNILGQVTLESRGTAWYQTVEGATVARAELFGGSATHYLDTDARGSEKFVGASVDLQYRVTEQLTAGLELDALRTFERDPILEDRVADGGVRAFATVSWTHELHRRDVELDLDALRPPPQP